MSNIYSAPRNQNQIVGNYTRTWGKNKRICWSPRVLNSKGKQPNMAQKEIKNTGPVPPKKSWRLYLWQDGWSQLPTIQLWSLLSSHHLNTRTCDSSGLPLSSNWPQFFLFLKLVQKYHSGELSFCLMYISTYCCPWKSSQTIRWSIMKPLLFLKFLSLKKSSLLKWIHLKI